MPETLPNSILTLLPLIVTIPIKKVTKADAIVAEMGSLEGSNHRCINKMLVSQVLPTCQLQMGMTELKPGKCVEHHAGARAQPPYGSLLLF